MRHHVQLCSTLVALSLIGCGDDAATPSADVAVAEPDVQIDSVEVTPEADITPEVSPDDVAEADSPSPTEEVVAAPDVPEEPTETETAWGTITGACGAALAAAQSPDAALLHTTYTFAAGAFDTSGLSGKPLTRYQEPNAGGSSKCSEVMSMQLLIDCEGAEVTKTETEVVYDTEGKIADYLVTLGEVSAGVSVTRAYMGPVVDTYSVDDATELLTKKLEGLAEAATNVSAADAWTRGIVHVWTLHSEWAETVATAWEALAPSVKGDALVLVTVEAGSDYIVTDACDD